MGLTERFNKEGQKEIHRLSLVCFQESGFKNDLTEFIQDHNGDEIEESIDGLRFENEAWRIEPGGWDGKVHAFLRWGKKEDDSKAHQIEIIFEQDKTIHILAGMLGRSILLPETWRRSKEAKRKALDRAWAHPGMPPSPYPTTVNSTK